MRAISRKTATVLGGLALAGGGVFFTAPSVQAAPTFAPGQAKCSYNILDRSTSTDTTVHLRSRSSARSASLGLLREGTWVKTHCVDKSRKWVKLTVTSGPNDDRVGWVMKRYLAIPMEPSDS